MFDSLRNKIMPLSDDLIVYPSHGAGSACGKNMSKETTDTLGNQKSDQLCLASRYDAKKNLPKNCWMVWVYHQPIFLKM